MTFDALICTIAITGRRDAARIELTVTDNGVGIRAEAQARLFEPFFTTRQVGQGKGMGLAVSRGLMRAQGGAVTLVGSSPEGTTMSCWLPQCDPPA